MRALFKTAAILLLVAGLLAGLESVGIRSVPHGSFQRAELCTDCGRMRHASGWWLVRPAWVFRSQATPTHDTLATRFLKPLSPLSPEHHWRPCPETLLSIHPEEEHLARLVPGIAAEAVRARLARPECDGIRPRWFDARGWPPADAGEARAWWAGARPAR